MSVRKEPLTVNILRNGNIESQHRVHVALTDSQGKVTAGFGDPYLKVYLRSTAKPIQAIPLIESGTADAIGLSDEEIANCCASHMGHDSHVAIVRSILEKGGNTPDMLQSRPHQHEGEEPWCCAGPAEDVMDSLRYNCSGKHAGFLAVTRRYGEDLNRYRDPRSRLQKEILQHMSELSDTPLAELESTLIPDGCGAPIWMLPINRLAQSFARMAQATEGTHFRIRQAIRQHPKAYQGEGGHTTGLVDVFGDYLFGKNGAEGAYAIGTYEGQGLALKVEDGQGARVFGPVLYALIKYFSLCPDGIIEKYAPWGQIIMKNAHNYPVGEIVVDI